MKAIFVLLALALGAQAAPILPSWTNKDALDMPKSAYYDPGSHYIFVSNVAGAPDRKDGRGWITRLTLSGKVVNAHWVDGLNAPKGMRASAGRLWVTDIDSIVEVDTKDAKVLRRIQLPGAKFLSDVAIAPDGTTLYVSDTVSSTIFKVATPGKKPEISPWFHGPDAEGPGGLFIDGNSLIVAAWGMPDADFSTPTPGRLYKVNLKTAQKSVITPGPIGNLDGLEKDPSTGDYFVSDWVKGIVYRVTSKGAVTPLLTGFKNSADIGVVPERHLLLVPEMGGNQLKAYDLRELSGLLQK